MMYNPVYAPSADREGKLAVPQSVPPEKLSPESSVPTSALSTMSVSVLAEQCIREFGKYRKGEPSDDRYGLELFRRAVIQQDQLAWEWLQRCYSQLVLSWIRRHPKREAAYRLDSEKNYVAQAFARFWLATTHNQKLEFGTLAAALQYLRASLNGVIIDTLRAYSRSKEAPLPEPGTPGEPLVEDAIDYGELWSLLRDMFPGEQEQRLIYLSFYCGLKPREIVRYRSQKFSDVQKVYRLRRNIYERLLRDTGHLRWRLGIDGENS